MEKQHLKQINIKQEGVREKALVEINVFYSRIKNQIIRSR
jgi:hypothetical protein